MGDLQPVAFDIETSGLDQGAEITVAGLETDVGAWLALNTGGRVVAREDLEVTLEAETDAVVHLDVHASEAALLEGLDEFAATRLDDDRHYITAFNGERWRNGFDLPFLRSACTRHNAEWPFPGFAYADVMDMMERFDTGDTNDLVGVYDRLIGGDDCDPFADSGAAVDAYEDGKWTELLLHNLADIRRTRKLAVLAERYVPRSDFQMKNLSPPNTE